VGGQASQVDHHGVRWILAYPAKAAIAVRARKIFGGESGSVETLDTFSRLCSVPVQQQDSRGHLGAANYSGDGQKTGANLVHDV
jgi:hypothetical protein